jgi:thioesterase domain-containing protein/acyl carrier protein
LPSRPGSVGRIPEGELAIRGDDGASLRPGKSGRVMLRGPSVMPGYLVDDIEGAPSGLENGWLETGDIGVVDQDGFLTIVGRSKEIINRGGEKISPYDVERALLAHPAVREAAAFAVPHPRLGENVGAAVVFHPGQQATSLELIDFVYDRLAPFQMPRHVHILDSLPVGATGKISRSQLSAKLADQRPPSTPPVASLEILIADIWQRHLGRSDIGIDDDFFEIGGDSLQATEMLLETEQQTHHRVAPSEVRAQLTIRQLCDVLAGAAEARHEVMTKAKAGDGPPVFLCHGDYLGWGFYGFRLAERLKTDGPVYLLHSLIDPGKGVHGIDDMARRYLPEISRVAPSGPVRLVGYCHGGLAALQVAHELEKAGRVVDSVVLIDSLSLNARPTMRWLVPFATMMVERLPGRVGERVRRSAGPSLWRLATHLLARDRAIGRRFARAISTGKVGFSEDSQRDVYYQAMARYVPPRIKAEVISLVCDEYADKKEYATGAWAHVAPVVRSERIPGGHTSCISRHFGELADCLNRLIGPADTSNLAPAPRRVGAAE